MEEPYILPPDPARMIEGLRDTGYEFNTAVADIIDNSIAADAGLIDIHIDMDFRGNIRIAIADDGIGMNERELLNAMKYGSQRRADPASLGKFGLGLKTASTAFCRKLTVLSKPDASAPVLQATWDLDHVVRVREWELLRPDPDEIAVAHLDEVAPAHSGTVVVWENVDRVLAKEYQNPGGRHAQKALSKITKSLDEHIACVYQRFIDHNDRRARNVLVRLNGEEVKPWDPYCEGVAELVASEEVPVEMDNGKEASFTVRAFVLPRREDFRDDTEGRRARITNDRQGLYIYREQRLIHDADWLGMYQKEPHYSLLRVEFSFTHELDDAFHVDIKKSRILLNEDLWAFLRDRFLPAPRRAAAQVYRKGQQAQVREKTNTAHDASNRAIGLKEADLDTANVDVLDPSSGEVEITNREGKLRLKLKVSSALKPGQCFVEPSDGLDDGMLWEPCIIDTHKAVRINRTHPYYHKVYVPNLSSGVTVQGMDSLLWALCAAELGTVNDASLRHFSELRFEVSRLLRRLVDDLPEPDLGNDDQA